MGRQRAVDHTQAMLGWWRSTGIEHADVAVRRLSGAMIWQRQLDIEHLPLPWMRAENTRSADIYVRPARGSPWPLVFLDDVEVRNALAVAAKYTALVIRTSVAGGCHIWLACDRCLDERERAYAQRWLARRIDADPASTSGEHLGRLAGFRNWKRNGEWVNVLSATTIASAWDPSAALLSDDAMLLPSAAPVAPSPTTSSRSDSSPSGRDWAWVCSCLDAGHDPDAVCRQLVAHAAARRGRDAERYARRTVERALRRMVPGQRVTHRIATKRDTPKRPPSLGPR